jgi:hypothetical protein
MFMQRTLLTLAAVLAIGGAVILISAKPADAARYCDSNAVYLCWCLTGYGGQTGVICVNPNSTQTLIYCDPQGQYSCTVGASYMCPGGTTQTGTGSCTQWAPTYPPGICVSGQYTSCQ